MSGYVTSVIPARNSLAVGEVTTCSSVPSMTAVYTTLQRPSTRSRSCSSCEPPKQWHTTRVLGGNELLRGASSCSEEDPAFFQPSTWNCPSPLHEPSRSFSPWCASQPERGRQKEIWKTKGDLLRRLLLLQTNTMKLNSLVNHTWDCTSCILLVNTSCLLLAHHVCFPWVLGIPQHHMTLCWGGKRFWMPAKLQQTWNCQKSEIPRFSFSWKVFCPPCSKKKKEIRSRSSSRHVQNLSRMSGRVVHWILEIVHLTKSRNPRKLDGLKPVHLSGRPVWSGVLRTLWSGPDWRVRHWTFQPWTWNTRTWNPAPHPLAHLSRGVRVQNPSLVRVWPWGNLDPWPRRFPP